MKAKGTIAVRVVNLRKNFGKIVALDGISFSVRSGEIYGLVGPNAAGKTTTLRIVATLLVPSSGSVNVFGYDVVNEAEKVRELISYLPEEAGAYKNLSGEEYLRFMANLYRRQTADEILQAATEISGLGKRLKDKIKGYSRGMLRRLLVARTLAIKPKLAILDEPTSGVDVIHSLHIREMIKNYAKEHGVTILISSHNMLEMEYLCDRIALIHKGRIIAEGSPKELKQRWSAENLEQAFRRSIEHV